jgi:hypothetical protein
MIDHYTIKVNPAVSQKEIIKALNEWKSLKEIDHLNKLKARIEIIGSGEAIERVMALLEELSKPKL